MSDEQETPAERDRRLDRVAAAAEALVGTSGELLDTVREQARREGRAAANRRLDLARVRLRGALAMSLGILVASTLVAAVVVDVHTHRGHVDPLEERIAVLEERAGVDPVPRSSTTPPLFRTPGQESPAVGPLLYVAGLVAAVTVPLYVRRVRRLELEVQEELDRIP